MFKKRNDCRALVSIRKVKLVPLYDLPQDPIARQIWVASVDLQWKLQQIDPNSSDTHEHHR